MSSLDVQTWIFPPPGSYLTPTSAGAAFGPVANGDTVELRWVPPDRKPQIKFGCTGRAILPNVTSFATSPFNFTFNPNDELLNAAQSNGKCVAWFAFDDPVARAPYTVTFDFDFRARSNPTTWRPADQVLAALGVSAVSGASASAPPTATVTVTAAPEATAVGTSSSLSAGAAAGIGVAVTAIVMGMALALVGWRLWKARRHTEAVELSRGSGAGATIAAAAPPVYMKHQSRPSELNARSPAMMEDNRVRQFELNG